MSEWSEIPIRIRVGAIMLMAGVAMHILPYAVHGRGDYGFANRPETVVVGMFGSYVCFLVAMVALLRCGDRWWRRIIAILGWILFPPVLTCFSFYVIWFGALIRGSTPGW